MTLYDSINFDLPYKIKLNKIIVNKDDIDYEIYKPRYPFCYKVNNEGTITTYPNTKNINFNILNKYIVAYTYNINLDKLQYKGEVNTGDYNTCSIYTKHFYFTLITHTKGNEILDMYLNETNFDVINTKIHIYEMRSYKLTLGKCINLKFININYTVGIIHSNYNNSGGVPEKYPILGISDKRIFIPDKSFFLEGCPHVNLFQPKLNFNYRPTFNQNYILYENYLSQELTGLPIYRPCYKII